MTMNMTIQELLAIPVKYVMTTNLIKIQPNTYLDEVDKIFNESNIHHLPVVNEGGELVGMVSHSDILVMKHWGSRFDLESSEKRNSFVFSKLLASDVMIKSLITVGPDATLEECAELLKSNSYHSLPVVENRQIIGIITSYDLLLTAYRKAIVLD